MALVLKNLFLNTTIQKTLDVVNLGQKQVNITNTIKDQYLDIDETKMIIAIRNIIDNAVKYSDTLEPINIIINQYKNKITISIQSIGNPIDDSEKNNLFKPFYRSQNKVHTESGFGLGLTICKKIIDAHSGTIELITNNTKTCFNIILPQNRISKG